MMKRNRNPPSLKNAATFKLVSLGVTPEQLRAASYPPFVVSAVKKVRDVTKAQSVVRRHLAGSHRLRKRLTANNRPPDITIAHFASDLKENPILATRFAVAYPHVPDTPRHILEVIYPQRYGQSGDPINPRNLNFFNQNGHVPSQDAMMRAYRRMKELQRKHERAGHTDDNTRPFPFRKNTEMQRWINALNTIF